MTAPKKPRAKSTPSTATPSAKPARLRKLVRVQPKASKRNSQEDTIMKLAKEVNSCPVCGYDDLAEPARNRTGGASMEICPCCGFQFGVTDDDDGISYDEFRETWISGGMRWQSKGKKLPQTSIRIPSSPISPSV
ncbi:MAG: hypothetical protein IPK32_18395 [Verrucomicrobiaceae bacterium]|nr:hypothetical protein [Verrucomicrobiaceae bacterium]